MKSAKPASLRSQERLQTFHEIVARAIDGAALMTVQELGVLEALSSGPRTLDDLARECGVRAARLRPFLALVEELGFVCTSGERYALLEGDETLFSADESARRRLQGASLEAAYARFGSAARVLRSDCPEAAAGTGGDVDILERSRFLAYHHALAQEVAPALARLLSPLGFSRIADLGCGGGTYSHALLAEVPHATAVLVDRPGTEGVARRLAREAHVEERISFSAADLLEGGYGDGFDLILVSNVLHCYGPEENRQLLEVAARALRPGGRLVLKDYAAVPGDPGHALLRFDALLAISSRAGRVYTSDGALELLSGLPLTLDTQTSLQGSFVLIAQREESPW